MDSSSLPEVKEDEQSPEDPFLRGLQRTATDFYAELQNSSDLGYANGILYMDQTKRNQYLWDLITVLKP